MNLNENLDERVAPSGKLMAFRQGRTPIQQKVLDEVWGHFLKTGDWPVARILHSQHGTKAVREALTELGGSIVWEENNQNGQGTYRLSFLGVLLGTDGEKLQRLVSRFFEYQREIFKRTPEKQQISSREISAALQITTQEGDLLGKLVRIGNFAGGSYGSPDGSWTVGCMREAEDFPPGDLVGDVEAWAFQGYQTYAPVSHADRLMRMAQQNCSLDPFPPNVPVQSVTQHEIADGDPLKRRYQVFVSSTFTDLIEERKHVMQALLATKCIPSGMELFPAASTAQWNLIKRVIDDCDYYVVIVAGRYGSVGADGISYTEKEFDYAGSIGKPILGFYHSDIRKILGERLEESDDARKKLANFTAKVKERLCQSWNTPEGLASALKSAIINAIETDPKPGWVRADTIPSWALVRSLRERIAELEGRSSAESQLSFPAGDERIEIRARISWEETDLPKDRWGATHKSMEHTFNLTWDELLMTLGLKPGASTNRHGLLQAFTHNSAKRLEPQIRQNNPKHILRLNATIDGTLFDRILQTFLARKLLKQVAPPRGITKKSLYWQLAPKGIQRLAELTAITS